MASSRRVQQPILQKTPLRFFKVVVPSTLEDKKLRIPQKFVRKVGHELSDVAAITVPNGRAWEVRLAKDGRKIWFDDGWQDFVESNSISLGYFLVFKYGKNSTFRVHIFDMSALEIDYPNNDEESINDKQSSEFKDEKEGEDCVEITEQSSNFKDEMEKKYSPLTQQKQPKPTSCSAQGIKINCQSTASLENTKVKHGCECQCHKCKWKRMLDVNEVNNDNEYGLRCLLEEMGVYISEKCKRILEEERERVIKIIRSLKLKKPSFMVILRSKKKDCRDLYVPVKFARKFVNRDVKSIPIQGSTGIERYIQICRRPNAGFFLSRGWKKFSEEENLKEGDICIFELIRTKDILLKLSVFRA